MRLKSAKNKKNKMNRFVVQGFLNTIKYLPDACIVYVDDFKKGFKKPNGEIVDDKYFSWKIIFKGYFKKYINEHFSNGMLVEIDAEMYPYAIQNGKLVDGYSCLGKSIDISSYPRSGVKQEMKMIKESQENSTDIPNLQEFNAPDF